MSKDAARLHGQLELRHADRTGLVVDLQGRLSPVYNRFQPDFERMWTGREAVLRLGETVNTLALEQSRDKLRYGWFDARPRLGRQSRSRLKRGLGLN